LFANTVGRKYGIFVNSGSSANFLAVNFLKSNYFRNIRNIDRILTPACGFPTTINPIIQNGFKVTFIDVDLETLNINI
jgi:CDP-6-deoxy-D-xylo-4-hexulose-3-dehydrase